MCRHHKASVLPESAEYTPSEKSSPSLPGQSCSSLTPLENSDLNLKRKMASSHKASQRHKNSLHLLWGATVPNATAFTKGEGVQWRPDKHGQAIGHTQTA